MPFISTRVREQRASIRPDAPNYRKLGGKVLIDFGRLMLRLGPGVNLIGFVVYFQLSTVSIFDHIWRDLYRVLALDGLVVRSIISQV